MNDLVPAVVGGAIAIVAGAVGLLGRQLFDRRMASHAARRALYVDLLSMLMGRRDYVQSAVASRDVATGRMTSEKLDQLNALLSIDATESVTAKARECFGLDIQFRMARSMKVPVERHEEGHYRPRPDLVQDQPQDVRDQTMQTELRNIADQYSVAVEDLAAQIRREVHSRL